MDLDEFLPQLTDTQRRYISARLLCDTVPEACKAIGIHRSTPHKWSNRAEIEQCVAILQSNALKAAKVSLENLCIEAVKALKKSLGDRAHRVRAAEAILDRAGLPRAQSVDVTSGGEPIKAVVYIPDNDRGDRD